jgi:hypothetical protein
MIYLVIALICLSIFCAVLFVSCSIVGARGGAHFSLEEDCIQEKDND